MIALGLFLPVVAVLGYLLIALFYLVPFHRIRQSERPARPGDAKLLAVDASSRTPGSRSGIYRW